ncbi:MFS transporter (plasmid) [Roseibium aggregatum]|uniref:MFS transporter n=1 Tax=Roseibium aggregatum TaxID=187304 RepID=UPI001E56F381|nr:MFS transporter [Roseibium aggregatum]UES60124.1 MFS transporter [Roseibium aggregatum]
MTIASNSQSRLDVAADRAALVLVVGCGTAFAAAQGLTYPLISIVLEKRAFSPTLSGLNTASYAFGLIVATLAISRLSRVLRGDRLIVFGLLGCAGSLAVFATADDVRLWFPARFCLGFFANLVFILSEAWLLTASPSHLRGRLSGLYGMGICGGFAFGPLAIPLFGTENGHAFAAIALYVICIAVAALLLNRWTHSRPEPVPVGSFVAFFRAEPLLIAVVFVFAFANIASISTMPVYFLRSGYTENLAALAITILAVATAAMQPVAGWLLDVAPPRAVALSSSLGAGLLFLVLSLTEPPMAALTLFGLTGALTYALNTYVLTVLGERFTGGALVAGTAAFALSFAFGSGAGSTLTGAAIELAGPPAAPIAIGAILIALALVLSVSGRVSRRIP